MIYTFIADTDRSSDVQWNSLNIQDELQERVNTASFVIFANSKPSAYDEVFIYNGSEIVTVGSNFVTVTDLYADFNLFRIGDTIWVGLNTSDEAKYVISAIDEDSKKITFSTNLSGISAGEFIGHRIFGGNIIQTKDSNLHLVENIVYQILCVDFTKIFDKGQIIDTFEDRTARYMINSVVNDFVNFNQVVDQLDYADNTAIQAVYTESGVANAATSDSSSPFEKDHWGSFASSGSGTATWTGAIGSSNISSFVGVTSGNPTKGKLSFWIKHTDYTDITNYTLRIGSDSSNYIEITKTPAQLEITEDDEIYITLDITDFSVNGTPDWTNVDYALIQFVCTGTTTVKLAGIRVHEAEFFKHYPNVQTGPTIDDMNLNYVKPITFIQRLARETGFFWYIDYERNIHFFNQSTNVAPFNVDNTSSDDNFIELRVDIDAKNLKNTQFILGGEDQSTSTYSEAVKGDDSKREFPTKSQFANLEINLDDSTTSNVAEAGTNTTNIKVTGHGLVTGDYITNRTRSDTVREITKIDDDNYTVEAISGQTSGDTITNFDQAQTVGIEGIVDETTVDYVSNSNGKRVRSSSSTATLTASEFLQFKYNERIPIITAAQNGASISSFQSTIGHTDGIFRGLIMRDSSIKTQAEARNIAAAEVERYGNAIIKATFKTHIFGLVSGQEINIKDTTSGRNVDQKFMIQRVMAKPVAGDTFQFNIVCSSVLYGIVEFFQQLLRAASKISVNENAVPINLIQNTEIIAVSDVATISDKNTQSETITVADSPVSTVVTPPFQYGPGGSPQARYNLSSYS